MGSVSAQENVLRKMRKILEIFCSSEGVIRPHFIVTGESGSGKSHTINQLGDEFEINFVEINAAQLTKEGTSGNSLSKALSPLANAAGKLTIVFVDEFDKLFISGNSNSHLAHETTNGVQNEFLKVLEASHASVYSDFGKYLDVPVDKVLFVFAGAFNGEAEIDIDRLRDFGIKTEFLGRVGLTFPLKKVTLEDLRNILDNSNLLKTYLTLFPDAEKKTVVQDIMKVVEQQYEKNTLGVRLLNTLMNQYFINDGKLEAKEVKAVSFQKKLSFGSKPNVEETITGL